MYQPIIKRNVYIPSHFWPSIDPQCVPILNLMFFEFLLSIKDFHREVDIILNVHTISYYFNVFSKIEAMFFVFLLFFRIFIDSIKSFSGFRP